MRHGNCTNITFFCQEMRLHSLAVVCFAPGRSQKSHWASFMHRENFLIRSPSQWRSRCRSITNFPFPPLHKTRTHQEFSCFPSYSVSHSHRSFIGAPLEPIACEWRSFESEFFLYSILAPRSSLQRSKGPKVQRSKGHEKTKKTAGKLRKIASEWDEEC